jgi:hypothetical protein
MYRLGIPRRGISIMEDEGGMNDHSSGISGTDGAWHHIAVTWSSSTGEARLYDNARLMWVVTVRAPRWTFRILVIQRTARRVSC